MIKRPEQALCKEGAQKGAEAHEKCPDQLPTAAVAGNYHKPGDLAQHSFITLQFQKPGVHNRPLRGQKLRYTQGCILSGSRAESVFS